MNRGAATLHARAGQRRVGCSVPSATAIYRAPVTPKEPKKNIFLIPCPPGGSHTLYSWVNSVETEEEGGGTQAAHLPPSGHGLEITELQMHSFPGKQ